MAQRYDKENTIQDYGDVGDSAKDTEHSNQPVSINEKFSRVMKQLRLKNNNLAGRKQRGYTVGSKINTGLRRGPEH